MGRKKIQISRITDERNRQVNNAFFFLINLPSVITFLISYVKRFGLNEVFLLWYLKFNIGYAVLYDFFLIVIFYMYIVSCTTVFIWPYCCLNKALYILNFSCIYNTRHVSSVMHVFVRGPPQPTEFYSNIVLG